MRRELRSVSTEKVLGVVDDSKTPPLDAGATAVLRGVVRQFGDGAVEALLRDGWSNGYLYLAEPA